MRFEYESFAQDRELSLAWDWADHPDPDMRLDSLFQLAFARDRLPAAMFFTAPARSRNPRWQELIEATEQICRCRSRRIIRPMRHRDELISATHPRRFVIESTFSSQSTTLRDMQMVIGPQGSAGSIDTAYAMWSATSSGVLVQQRPFMADARHESPQIWMAECSGREYRPADFFIPMEMAQRAISAHGGLRFFQKIDNPGDPAKFVGMPLCDLVAISVDTEREVVAITFEVDAPTMLFASLDEEDRQVHRCTA